MCIKGNIPLERQIVYRGEGEREREEEREVGEERSRGYDILKTKAP